MRERPHEWLATTVFCIGITMVAAVLALPPSVTNAVTPEHAMQPTFAAEGLVTPLWACTVDVARLDHGDPMPALKPGSIVLTPPVTREPRLF